MCAAFEEIVWYTKDVRVLGVVLLLATTGCPVDVAIKATEAVPRGISEASRAHEVSAWAGRYYFTECAPGTTTCWVYDVNIDRGGGGTLRADGPQVSTHVNLAPKVDDGFLVLNFDSYIDGNPDGFIHSPFGGEGFGNGAVLATIGHDRAGHWCFVFGQVHSTLNSKWVCGQ